MPAGTSRPLQDPRAAPPRVEALLHEGAGAHALALVVARRGLEHRRRLLDRAEAEEAVGVGEREALARMLDHLGVAAREVAERPVAHPRVAKPPARGLRAG